MYADTKFYLLYIQTKLFTLNSWIRRYRLALITPNLETADNLAGFMVEVWLLFEFVGQGMGFLKQFGSALFSVIAIIKWNKI